MLLIFTFFLILSRYNFDTGIFFRLQIYKIIPRIIKMDKSKSTDKIYYLVYNLKQIIILENWKGKNVN